MARRSSRLGVVAPRHGIEGAREFFALLDTFQVHEFQVLDLLASPTQVAAQIVIELTYPSGGRVRDEELHLWRFDGDHKIAAPRHYVAPPSTSPPGTAKTPPAARSERPGRLSLRRGGSARPVHG